MICRLHQCNVEEDILPEHLFYNAAVASHVNLLDEWRKRKEAGPQSQVFNYCDYPFLIDDLTKYKLIQHDFGQTKSVQVMIRVDLFPIYLIVESFRHTSM